MKPFLNSIKSLPTSLKITIGLSLFIFIISLTQPSFYVEHVGDSDGLNDSFFLFLFGWMSFLGGAYIPFIIWLANPVFFLSIIWTINNNAHSLKAALYSTSAAILFLQLDTIMTSESGSTSKIIALGIGYKLWLTSFLILTIGLIINLFLMKRRTF